jgi:hypothetical protein
MKPKGAEKQRKTKVKKRGGGRKWIKITNRKRGRRQ